MKTAMQELKEYLETKVLPCPQGNDYVYGMNVAHTNLIEYMMPYFLEKEKEQIRKSFIRGDKNRNMHNKTINSEDYYNETYQNK